MPEILSEQFFGSVLPNIGADRCFSRIIFCRIDRLQRGKTDDHLFVVREGAENIALFDPESAVDDILWQTCIRVSQTRQWRGRTHGNGVFMGDGGKRFALAQHLLDLLSFVFRPDFLLIHFPRGNDIGADFVERLRTRRGNVIRANDIIIASLVVFDGAGISGDLRKGVFQDLRLVRQFRRRFAVGSQTCRVNRRDLDEMQF